MDPMGSITKRFSSIRQTSSGGNDNWVEHHGSSGMPKRFNSLTGRFTSLRSCSSNYSQTESLDRHTSSRSVGTLRLGSLSYHSDHLVAFQPKNFIDTEVDEAKEPTEDWSPRRTFISCILTAYWFKFFLALTVVASLYLVIATSDAQAAGKQLDNRFVMGSRAITGVFALEIIVRLYVYRGDMVRGVLDLLDLILVAAEVTACLLSWSAVQILVAILRPLRMIRIIRLLRTCPGFRELYLILFGLYSAASALACSAIMVCALLLFWSIVAVNVLHPLNVQIAVAGKYEECERCPHAYASVGAAFLTFVETIITCDNWGEYSFLLVEESPWVMPLLLAAYISVNVGLLNLVLASILESADRAREADAQSSFVDKNLEYATAVGNLWKLANTMNLSGSGEISYQEFMIAAAGNSEFKQLLHTLDVQAEDLPILFQVVDRNQSGNLDRDEFASQFHRMRKVNMSSQIVLLKSMLKRVAEHVEKSMEDIARLSASLQRNCPSALAFYGDGSTSDPLRNGAYQEATNSTKFCDAIGEVKRTALYVEQLLQDSQENNTKNRSYSRTSLMSSASLLQRSSSHLFDSGEAEDDKAVPCFLTEQISSSSLSSNLCDDVECTIKPSPSLVSDTGDEFTKKVSRVNIKSGSEKKSAEEPISDSSPSNRSHELQEGVPKEPNPAIVSREHIMKRSRCNTEDMEKIVEEMCTDVQCIIKTGMLRLLSSSSTQPAATSTAGTEGSAA